MFRPLLLTAMASVALFGQADENPVFRSDVSLVRVDVQVLDRTARPVTSLQKEDFVLHENGKEVPILNFASEKMPIDILFLLDVSGSMRPHVERIARAAQSALDVLGQEDRIAIMVFDRQTRTRLPFTVVGDRVYQEFDNVLDRERFNGGTDITRGMLDAAEYMRRNSRKDARRGIIILTDDQTEFDRDDERVGQALIDADAVMSALLAPDAIGNRGGFPGGGGGSYPPNGRRRTGGGGWGGLGTIILGGGGYPGGGYPGGGGGGGGVRIGRTRSAGTAEIAQASGGESMPVDSTSALETTVARLRQRYALYFNLPPGARQGQQRRIHVALAGTGATRYPNAELRYRQNYLAPASNDSDPNVTVISESKAEAPAANSENRPVYRRRPVGDGTGGGRGPNPQVGASEGPAPVPANVPASSPSGSGGWRKAEAKDAPAPVPAEAAPVETPAPAAEPAPKKGGWRKVTDPEPAAPPAQVKQP
jgi:VWFA-related protein